MIESRAATVLSHIFGFDLLELRIDQALDTLGFSAKMTKAAEHCQPWFVSCHRMVQLFFH